MTTSLVSPDVARWVAKQLFLENYPDHGGWFDLAWEATLKGPRPSLESGPLSPLPGLGAGATTDPFTQQMARNFAVYAAGLIIDSPMAADALARRLIKAAEQSRGAKAFVARLAGRATRLIQESGAAWTVWKCGADEVVPMSPEYVSAAELEERFWAHRREYDIFIRDHSVFFPSKDGDTPIDLEKEERFILLVVFLRYRGSPLATDELYLRAYQQKSVTCGRSELELVDHYLKSPISALRDRIGSKISSFVIPRKSPNSGYYCTGRFGFCLALPSAAEERFRVRSALEKPDSAQPSG